MPSINGIILAGGTGRRMDGRDKGLISWQAQPLVEHVINGLKNQVQMLSINANRNIEAYRYWKYPVITDKDQRLLGPLAGVLVGLEHATTEWLAVAPCDSPLFPSDYVQRLLAAAQQLKVSVVWVRQHEQDHPLFCLIHQRLRQSLEDYLYQEGENKVLTFYKRHGLPVDFHEPAPYFSNFNTEQDLLAPMQKGHP